MGTITKHRTNKGEITYWAKVRKRGFPNIHATFTRITDAKAWIEQEESKIRLGHYFDIAESKKHTLSEAIDRFTKTAHPTTVQTAHLERWRSKLGAFFLNSVTSVKINEVVAEWKHALLGKALSDGTRNRYLSSLSVVFSAAKDWGWVSANPVRDARKFKESKGRIRFLSNDERESLLEACKQSTYRPLYLIVVLALSTGMRREEILGLTWEQVDLKKRVILLSKTKNSEPRRIAVRALALELFKQHSKIRPINSRFVFPGERESPAKERNVTCANERHFDIRKPWEDAIEATKIVNFRFHDLRHSCASYLAMNGASHLEIAEVLGHKTLQMVKRYSHIADSHVAHVVENMNRKIFR